MGTVVGVGWGERVAGTLEEHDVDEVALFGAADERGELVREDLVRRIDEDVVAVEIVGVELRTDVLHQINHETFVAARDDRALEARCILADFQATADGGRSIREHEAAAFEGGLVLREDVQVVGGSVAQVKSGEGRAAGEEEAALALEERVENLALERGQLVRSEGWRRLSDYAGRAEARLRTGHGLLMNGPESVCAIVAATLEDAGVRASILGSARAHPGYRVLLLGRSYAIARAVAFERRAAS